MLDKIVEEGHYEYMEESYEAAIVRNMGGVPVNIAQGPLSDSSYWVPPRIMRVNTSIGFLRSIRSIKCGIPPLDMGTKLVSNIFTAALVLSFVSLPFVIVCTR